MYDNLSMAEIENTNDFEAAKYRYENCRSNRWRGKWWEIICNIWKKTKKFAKKYFLDVINKVVRKLGEEIEDDIINYTYWIRLYNAQHETVFNKVGKSKDPIHRWEDILKERYCTINGVVSYEVKGLWEIRNQWAEGLESYLRAMLIKAHGDKYVPTDRFACELEEAEVFGYAETYLA